MPDQEEPGADLLMAAERCLSEAAEKDKSETRRGVLIERARQHIAEVREDDN